MRPSPARALRAAAAAAVAAAVVVPLGLLVASGPAEAAGLTRTTGYSCQYSGVESSVVPDELGVPVVGGLPVPVVPSLGGSDDVAVALRVDAPARVAAGSTLRLRGTATFTFGPNATATNAATVFAFLSDSFGLDVTADGQRRFVRITRLETSTSTPTSSKVTARFTLPDYLVPTTADRLSLALPSQAVVTNPVGTSPEAVAFTGVLRTDSQVQPQRTVACALRSGQRTALGSVAVTGASEPAETAPTDTATTPAATPPGDTGAGLGSTGSAPPATSSAPGGTAATPAPAAAAATTTPEALRTLAADPIPPATVAEGVALPPWSLVLVGGVVAGGVYLAIGSRQRLRQAGVVAGALGLLLVVPGPLNRTAPAEAATGQAQVTLLCVYQAEGSPEDTRARSQPTGVSITLDVPDSVAPGDVVTLTGSASVQAPEDIRSQAAQLGYNQLDAISDSFSVGLTVGSAKRQVFTADRWQTGRTAFSNPLVVRGPLSFPAFKVPDDATGSVRLELPRNEVLDRRPKPYSNGDTPPRVAMEFLATATGNGTSATYLVACWRNDGGAGTIATVPVRKAGATTGGESTAPDSDQAPAAGSGTTSASAGPGGPGGSGSSASGGADPSAAPTAGAVPGASTTPGAAATAPPLLEGATTTAAPTTAAASQDVTVPLWLVVVAVLVGLAAYGVAGWNQLRLRSLRRR